MRSKYVLAVCLLVGVSSVATADIVSYEADIDPTNVGSGSVVSLPQFDPALGTLTGVELYLEAEAFSGTIIWDNESDTITHVSLGIGATVTADAPESLTIIVVPLQEGEADVPIDNEPNDGDADFAGTDTLIVTGNTGSDSDSASPSTLGAYIGTETFDVTISSVLETTTSTSGGDGECQTTAGQYDGKVTVEYTYVPEPATLSLIGAGLGALLLRRKRR